MAFGIDDAIFVGIGLANAGMGVMGAQSQYAGQMQAYKDQLKFQKANEKFAKWQAKFNKKATDAQNKFQYWGQVVGYNREKAYINSLRNIEKVKSFKQAKVVFETRAAAGASYIQDSQALSAAYGEQSMQEAVSLQQYQWRALQTRGSVQAMEREGQSVDRIVNDYARQLGDYETLMQINQGIRSRQYTREQAAQVSQYLSRWNSQSFYEEQPYMDPVPPYAPLPTIMMPPPPSMTGAPPSSAALGLNIGTAILGGVGAGINAFSSLGRAGTPSSPSGPGTGGWQQYAG
jgi:hypothetical protein